MTMTCGNVRIMHTERNIRARIVVGKCLASVVFVETNQLTTSIYIFIFSLPGKCCMTLVLEDSVVRRMKSHSVEESTLINFGVAEKC